MDIRKLEMRRENLCKELDGLPMQENSPSKIELTHYLTGAIHYIDELLEAESERSGSSYRYRGDVMSGQDRDNMGRYMSDVSRNRSYGDGRGRSMAYDDMGTSRGFRDELERMMRDAPDERTRDAARTMLSNMGDTPPRNFY